MHYIVCVIQMFRSTFQSIVQNSLPQNDGFDAMEQEDPDRINTAIFYSITSTQKGTQMSRPKAICACILYILAKLPGVGTCDLMPQKSNPSGLQ